jgi:hypothetical protein
LQLGFGQQRVDLPLFASPEVLELVVALEPTDLTEFL